MLLTYCMKNKKKKFGIHMYSSAACACCDRILGLRVRIPTVTWKVCLLWILYVVQAEVSATVRTLVQRGLIVCECVTECYQKQQ